MVKANILGIDGVVKESIELPIVFSTEYKPKLIKRAVHLKQQKKTKKANPRAGK